ncbi:3-hydroxyacyl-CoA dehydrogenase family protein [Sulfobacillus harzensis]|uniref:3-hydroxyacyl-CoA dehydrogenase n=1 Tax=Sulfobacillus harzensis TaxID=2729629 RepID=A0A7Y0L0D3_9FIRM|nr:3-hydroxyacyl-CoA dehydrogenase family protein [Sulfobacillus harzensis]NMP20952.1 3-hydroxyacyl-CoA dehydrogenase [Sulfobacillus harzensis]
MTRDTVFAVGGTVQERERWSDTFKGRVAWLDDDQLDAASSASLVVEISLGPLTDKRRRLRELANRRVKRIVSAASTATVHAQRIWMDESVPILGLDPLLVMAGGRTQTVSGSDDMLPWLHDLWPDWAFRRVDDTVGLIFSREILPIINEAAAFFEQGLTARDIDQGVRLGLNYPRGPIQWAEHFGWPAVYWGLRALEDMYGPRFRPHPWIRREVGSSLVEREE